MQKMYISCYGVGLPFWTGNVCLTSIQAGYSSVNNKNVLHDYS
jgi:hypothetical protein